MTAALVLVDGTLVDLADLTVSDYARLTWAQRALVRALLRLQRRGPAFRIEA